MNAGSMFKAATGYLRSHPDELVRVVRNAAGLRFGVPLDAVRWLATQLDSAPRGLELTALPPGLRASATIELMGNSVRASAVVFVESVEMTATSARVQLRFEDVALDLIESRKDSPLAMLLQSGALDLSRPGNLAAHLPHRPAMLVDAKDDRVVVDLMQHPKVAANPLLQRVIAVAAQIVAVNAIETDWEHLDILLRPFPTGLPNALSAVQSVL